MATIRPHRLFMWTRALCILPSFVTASTKYPAVAILTSLPLRHITMSFADIIPNPFAAVLLVNAALTGSPKVSRATSSGNGFGLPINLILLKVSGECTAVKKCCSASCINVRCHFLYGFLAIRFCRRRRRSTLQQLKFAPTCLMDPKTWL